MFWRLLSYIETKHGSRCHNLVKLDSWAVFISELAWKGQKVSEFLGIAQLCGVAARSHEQPGVPRPSSTLCIPYIGTCTLFKR